MASPASQGGDQVQAARGLFAPAPLSLDQGCVQGWAGLRPHWENSDTSFATRERGEGHVNVLSGLKTSPSVPQDGTKCDFSQGSSPHSHTLTLAPTLHTKHSDQRPGKRRPEAEQEIASRKLPRMLGWECLHCQDLLPSCQGA